MSTSSGNELFNSRIACGPLEIAKNKATRGGDHNPSHFYCTFGRLLVTKWISLLVYIYMLHSDRWPTLRSGNQITNSKYLFLVIIASVFCLFPNKFAITIRTASNVKHATNAYHRLKPLSRSLWFWPVLIVWNHHIRNITGLHFMQTIICFFLST